MAGQIETQGDGRELDPSLAKFKKLREDTLFRLICLQDQAGREQLIRQVHGEAQIEAEREEVLPKVTALEEISVWLKAAANVRWARGALVAASAILQMTNGQVEFSGTFFSRSTINGEVIKRKTSQSVELVFKNPIDNSVAIIPSEKETVFLLHAYEDGSPLVRRNVERFASLTPFETISKVYSAVHRLTL